MSGTNGEDNREVCNAGIGLPCSNNRDVTVFLGPWAPWFGRGFIDKAQGSGFNRQWTLHDM